MLQCVFRISERSSPAILIISIFILTIWGNIRYQLLSQEREQAGKFLLRLLKGGLRKTEPGGETVGKCWDSQAFCSAFAPKHQVFKDVCGFRNSVLIDDRSLSNQSQKKQSVRQDFPFCLNIKRQSNKHRLHIYRYLLQRNPTNSLKNPPKVLPVWLLQDVRMVEPVWHCFST